jgi:hypothetical protein
MKTLSIERKRLACSIASFHVACDFQSDASPSISLRPRIPFAMLGMIPFTAIAALTAVRRIPMLRLTDRPMILNAHYLPAPRTAK